MVIFWPQEDSPWTVGSSIAVELVESASVPAIPVVGLGLLAAMLMLSLRSNASWVTSNGESCRGRRAAKYD